MSATKRHLKRVDITERIMTPRPRTIDKIIAQRFTVSCMSNAKWRKLFRTLDSLQLRPGICRWKFVDDERIFESFLPTTKDLEETHLVDGQFQPFVYKEIQWIEVVTDDQARIVEALEQVGTFEIEVMSDGVRLYGYR